MHQLNINLESLYGELHKWDSYKLIDGLMKEYPKIELYMAGGALRNIIWGEKSIKDIDIFLDYEDENKILEYISQYGTVSYGPFGAPRWHSNKEKNIYCDFIWIKKFYNGLWHCKDMVDVLNQFDFTANAIAINLKTGEKFNHQNGLRDLQSRTLRAIRFDYPNELFSPSHKITRQEVLWIRMSHYAKKYKMNIEPITKAWLEQHKEFYSKKEVFSQLFFEPSI